MDRQQFFEEKAEGLRLRREETPIKLLTPTNEANIKFWRMVGRGLHLHLNNYHGINNSSFLPTY